MYLADVFNINKQFTFYGVYHRNPINVAIHMICVPMILWTGLVMGTNLPSTMFPPIHIVFNDYLAFDLNWASVVAGCFLFYYYTLEPLAAFMYTPEMALITLTALKFAHRPDHMAVSGALHAFAWIAQFVGHGFAEKRAPALMDNILGAAVLAPFFVHLELLYKLGYRPELHKRIDNEISKEVTRIRKLEGDKKRAIAAGCQNK
ncbi:DUF962-domain-containing protein [Armillaria gallica]|uniref:DUF962-domain-containing protein n=1 Tax=Armillaria gallica TaxID=47427 RepID=A0A2H3E5M1_ARMGA|nr:DUF962-domain-containing protein [Armillaria gallica]